MSEIKFRAWDKVNKRMGYFHPGFSWNDEYDLWHLSEADNGFRMAEVPCGDNIELMRHTGLKDKNGKEIFEGDILRQVEGGECIGVYSVEWDYHTCGFYLSWGEHGDFEYNERMLLIVNHEQNWEVIGNIHEHSHLLAEAAV